MWPFKRDFKSYLNRTEVVRVNGFRFKIRPINTSDHMRGFNVMIRLHGTYDEKKSIEKSEDNRLESDFKKVKAHYRDVFLSSVLEPKLVLKNEDENKDTILVDHLLRDWEFSTSLYEKIIAVTFGKKKMMQSFFREAN